jgi:GPH family glycoside/pentoside/hexuronide:cation symporter
MVDKVVDAGEEVAGGERGPLPNRMIVALAMGYAGMSVLVNVLNTLIVFFYLPPDSAGLPTLVSDAAILGVLNLVALIAAAGRLTDSITDPIIAGLSDRSTHKDGRRIPFMRRGMVPATLMVILIFVPPVGEESMWNVVWLLGVQLILYISLTMYVTPAFALVADLGQDPDERLKLATYTSLGWSMGVLVAGLGFVLVTLLEGFVETYRAWQLAVVIVCTVGLALMAVPTRVIDEPAWSRNPPATQPLLKSVRTVLRNPFFGYYAAADFAYFFGLAIIQTGILFYVTVLLELEEWVSTILLLVLVVVSAGLFPLVAGWARRQGGGRRLTVFAFLLGSIIFLSISAMGLIDQLPFAQAVVPIAVFALPFAIISIMPQWILSDIAEHAARTGGEAQAGMFYATRTFLQKLAMTAGVVMFALLLRFGRDVGDDLGVRLTAIGGALLYVAAAMLFSRYDEDRLQRELAEAGQPASFRSDISEPTPTDDVAEPLES